MDSYAYMARLQRKCHQRAMHRRLEPRVGPITGSIRLMRESGRLTVNFIRESFVVLGFICLMAVAYDSMTGNRLIDILQWVVQLVEN